MKRTTIGTRASDGAHELVTRQFALAKWTATIVTVLTALVGILKCIIEGGLL